jgi:prefoldin subunit 5
MGENIMVKRNYEAEIRDLEKKQDAVDKKMAVNKNKLEECAKIRAEQEKLFMTWHDLRHQIDARREIASGYDAQLGRELKSRKRR